VVVEASTMSKEPNVKSIVIALSLTLFLLASPGCATCPPESRRCDGDTAMVCVDQRSDVGVSSGKGVRAIDCATQGNVCHVDGNAMCVAAGLSRCKHGDPPRCSDDGTRPMYCNDANYWANAANPCDHGCAIRDGEAVCEQP